MTPHPGSELARRSAPHPPKPIERRASFGTPYGGRGSGREVAQRFPTLARSAGSGVARCFHLGRIARPPLRTGRIRACFPHPIRRCAEPSPLGGEGAASRLPAVSTTCVDGVARKGKGNATQAAPE